MALSSVERHAYHFPPYDARLRAWRSAKEQDWDARHLMIRIDGHAHLCYPISMSDTTTTTTAPQVRKDLREPAFRRYEPFIARAAKESFIIERDAMLGLSQATFTARFRDALLAFDKYHYASTVIPVDFHIRDVIALPLADGRVQIRNTHADRLRDDTMVRQLAFAPASIVALMQRVAVKQVPSPVVLSYEDDRERDSVLRTADEHKEIDCMVRVHDGKLHFYTV